MKRKKKRRLPLFDGMTTEDMLKMQIFLLTQIVKGK